MPSFERVLTHVLLEESVELLLLVMCSFHLLRPAHGNVLVVHVALVLRAHQVLQLRVLVPSFLCH